MIELLLSLIPLAIGAAVQPPQVIALIFLLQTRRGRANGLAFVGGMTAFHLTLGALLWTLITEVETSVEAEGGQFDRVVGTGLAVLGLMLLVYALRRTFSGPDEDEAAATWLTRLQSVSPGQATLVGIAFLALDPKDWLFSLSAVDLIAAADFSAAASVLIYVFYLLLVQSFLLSLLILTLVAPQRAQKWLGRLNGWLDRHMRAIEIGVAALLGGYLLVVGLRQLGLF